MHKVNDNVSITKPPTLSLHNRTTIRRSYSSRSTHRTSLSCGESLMQSSHPQPSTCTASLQTPTYITGSYHLRRTSLMQPTHALNSRAPRYPGYPSPIFPPTSTTPIVRCPSVFKLRQTPHSHSHYPKAAIGHPSYLQGQVRSILPVTFASPKPYPYIHRPRPTTTRNWLPGAGATFRAAQRPNTLAPKSG